MNIENFIESVYREINEFGINKEYIELYAGVPHDSLKEILSTLHYNLIDSFRTMNQRLPTNEYGAHFWAEPSRSLIKEIEITLKLYNNLKSTEYAFDIDKYYYDLILKCRGFLSNSGGSSLPPNMPEIDLYYVIPIFVSTKSVTTINQCSKLAYQCTQIGEGSYAIVSKYKDDFYNRYFVVKQAKKNLSEKELVRFKREFEEMKSFSSPYVVDVFRYDENKNEYIMEYMDYTLEKYIDKNNSRLCYSERKNIVRQILNAFDYIHYKKRLHRDISPRNILIKEYEHTLVVKIADFGLIKTPESGLTTVNTEFKGYFNDPSLVIEGFDKYDMSHETYALTRIVYYVMTGKTTIDNDKFANLKTFIEKGLNPNREMRFKNVAEMMRAFHNI